MLTSNMLCLKKNYAVFLEEINSNEGAVDSTGVTVEMAKNGQPTLKIERESRFYYMHSKYNPQEEAEQNIAQLDNLEDYDHLFFYGVGLGYHAQALLNKYPDKIFTLYEPSPATALMFFEHQDLKNLPLKQMRSFYIEWRSELMLEYLQHFVMRVNEKVLLVIHPAYERILTEQVDEFSRKFKELLTMNRSNLSTNVFFEKYWTMNSLLNFPYILGTPNMIAEKKKYFEKKPVILIAAGPSLQDELEQLKYIKEHRLAYLFAVGSANKALIKNGIYPDAVTAYDPRTGIEGLDVFSDITESGITDIPLIFGSSVGHDAVKNYSGPKLHMFINQDTVSPYFIGSETIRHTNSMLSDAPSIAAITMELLAKLGCNLIVLVGQNFAFRNNQYYAEGIEYQVRPTQLSDQELAGLNQIESVDGDQVLTNVAFKQAKITMERYIQHLQGVDVINTTRGGAKIEGTTFSFLDEVIRTKLVEQAVESDWYVSNDKGLVYDSGHINQQLVKMDKAYKIIFGQVTKAVEQIIKIERLSGYASNEQLDKNFQAFDKLFIKLINNDFYVVFMRSMLRVQQQVLERILPDIRNNKNSKEKAKLIIEKFGQFIYDLQNDIRLIAPYYTQVTEQLNEPKVTSDNHSITLGV